MLFRILGDLDAWLSQTYKVLSVHARRYRLLYSISAVCVLAAGMFLSATSSEINLQKIQPSWLLFNTLVGAPIAIALTAIGLRLSARMVSVDLPFPVAYKTCCIATASNILPVPAGSVVHTSALISRGGSLMHSSVVVLFSNLISLGWVVILAAGTLVTIFPKSAIMFGGMGATLVTAGTLALAKSAPWKLVVTFLLLSILRSLVLIGRVLVSFAALGVAVNLKDAVLFSGAAAAGNLVVVAPSGMGVSESLAALLSLATSVEPAQAFIAIALNNLTALLFASATTIGLIAMGSIKRFHH